MYKFSIPIWVFILSMHSALSVAQEGIRPLERGMFSKFNADAQGRNSVNDYLLMELSDFVYGNRLLGDNDPDAQNNRRFLEHFKEQKGDIFYQEPAEALKIPTAPVQPLCVRGLVDPNEAVKGLKPVTTKDTPNSRQIPNEKRVLKTPSEISVPKSASEGKTTGSCEKNWQRYEKLQAAYPGEVQKIRLQNRAKERAYELRRYRFKFFHGPGNIGHYDPEVLVVWNHYNVIVVFRGTDRVGDADGDVVTSSRLGAGVSAWLEYEWGEWLGTNFNFTSVLDFKINGADGFVHPGFYNSLSPIRSRLLNFLDRHKSKNIWFTGHSLGGAQAQVLAADLYLQKRIRVKGIVTFGSPQLGDPVFASWFDRSVTPNGRFQRYEFSDDPVPQIFPIPLAEKAGQRNWFKSERGTANFFPNTRDNVALTVARGFAHFAPDVCMHRQQWYRRAMHYELPDRLRRQFPSPPPAPTRGGVCSRRGIERASAVTNR